MFGNFAMFLHSVLEGWLQGLQEIPAYATIMSFRALYMATSNYFTIIVFGWGIVGEAVASASRNVLVLVACAYAYSQSQHAVRLQWRTARPEREEWHEFFRTGVSLAALALFSNLAALVTPMMAARLENADSAQAALGIASRIQGFPGIISKVMFTIVTVLGSRYLGGNRIDVLKRFVTQLVYGGVAMAALGGVLFYTTAESLFSLYTNNNDVLPELNSLKLAMVLRFEIGMCTAIIQGVLYAAHKFKDMAMIGLVVQCTVYFPLMLTTTRCTFGEPTLLSLMAVDCVAEAARLAGMLQLVLETEILASNPETTTMRSEIETEEHAKVDAAGIEVRMSARFKIATLVSLFGLILCGSLAFAVPGACVAGSLSGP